MLLVILLAAHRESLDRFAVEGILNRNAKEFFAGSIRVGKISFDRRLRVRLEGISGAFQTRQGPVPLEVRSLASENSLLLLLSAKPVRFVVEGIHPRGSVRQGMKGTFSFRGGKDWQFEFLADFNDTDLEDLRWIDPQNLGGATGDVKGTIKYLQSAESDPVFEMKLDAPEPGGALQAKFFDLFLPYLPQSAEKERVARLVTKEQRLVKYQTAGLEVQMPQSDRMKILLRILVLDYNLKLTLNVDIKTDSKDTFFQIARIMGLIEVKL